MIMDNVCSRIIDDRWSLVSGIIDWTGLTNARLQYCRIEQIIVDGVGRMVHEVNLHTITEDTD